ncbi:MAG: aldehyde-activating protein [Gammaproteobacteria bacterium CG22_combo_CG10-13_8_21_14_all_40_8]|nr:MAG: aldehyde-activating protein [Gammaproteobacteria bacterium CG22_combo_CG10-13_8_21_14_all_40_8]
MIYQGACHCQAVKFEVEADENVIVQDCNCSICRLTGFIHLIVPQERFKLLQGEDELSTYRFGTGVAQHKFCRHCGVKSFYIPRSNPNGIDVNLRCLNPQPEKVVIEKFDGENWEKNAHSLAHLA